MGACYAGGQRPILQNSRRDRKRWHSNKRTRGGSRPPVKPVLVVTSRVHGTPLITRRASAAPARRCCVGDADSRVGHHPEPTPTGVIHITYDYLRRSQHADRAHVTDAGGTSVPLVGVTLIPMPRRIPQVDPSRRPTGSCARQSARTRRAPRRRRRPWEQAGSRASPEAPRRAEPRPP